LLPAIASLGIWSLFIENDGTSANSGSALFRDFPLSRRTEGGIDSRLENRSLRLPGRFGGDNAVKFRVVVGLVDAVEIPGLDNKSLLSPKP
jgi:hypothetical protein